MVPPPLEGIMNTKGMPSPALSEEDVRRIVRQELIGMESMICQIVSDKMNERLNAFYEQQTKQQIAVIEAMGLRVVKPQANQLCDKEEKEATQESGSYEDDVDHLGETD